MNDKNPINNINLTNNRNITDNSNMGNINTQKNINRCNSNYDRSLQLQQSPKIRTGKYRPLSSKPRPISLIDIDDKKIITKGTNIPAQFNRLSDEQLSKYIGSLDLRAGDNYEKKKLIQNFLNKNDMNIKSKNNTINKPENIINNNIKKKSNKTLTIETRESYNISKNIKKNKDINKNQKDIKNIKRNFNRPLSAQIRHNKDGWLPKGYPEYEYCVLNPKYFKENLKKNPFINKDHIHDVKEIKQKSDKSDIFFLGPISEKETKLLVVGNEEKSKNYNIKLGSDVFNLKSEFSNLMKSSETYLFKNNNPISTESKSFWTPRSNMPTYMNYPSVEYNILNPRAKCNTKTKEMINKECLQKKSDECKNVVNYMNPIFRQKNISSFYDITKGGMNRNFTYEKIYHDNPRSYYRKNNICTLHYNLFKNYKGIFDHPFKTLVNNKVLV